MKFIIIFVAIGVQALITVLVIFIIACKNNGMMPSFTVSSLGMFIYLFVKNLFAGPLGEELGWRGFALNEASKETFSYKVINNNRILVGIMAFTNMVYNRIYRN